MEGWNGRKLFLVEKGARAGGGGIRILYKLVHANSFSTCSSQEVTRVASQFMWGTQYSTVATRKGPEGSAAAPHLQHPGLVHDAHEPAPLGEEDGALRIKSCSCRSLGSHGEGRGRGGQEEKSKKRVVGCAVQYRIPYNSYNGVPGSPTAYPGLPRRTPGYHGIPHVSLAHPWYPRRTPGFFGVPSGEQHEAQVRLFAGVPLRAAWPWGSQTPRAPQCALAAPWPSQGPPWPRPAAAPSGPAQGPRTNGGGMPEVVIVLLWISTFQHWLHHGLVQLPHHLGPAPGAQPKKEGARHRQ